MKPLRYPVHIARDDQDSRFWNARIPNIAGGPDGLITCGSTSGEAFGMAVEMLDGYIMSKVEAGGALEAAPDSLPKGKGWDWIMPSSRVWVPLLIRQAREKANLNQAEAAKLLDVAPSTYNRWEQLGKCNATLQTLEKIARIFGRQLEVQLR